MMEKITRRSMLAAVPAMGMGPIVPAMAELADPLLEAVEAFEEGNRQFCALPDNFAPYADEDAAIEATYGPPFYVLDEWDQPARSLDGARAAIRVVLREGCLGNRMEASMLRAVLAYLDGLAA